MEIKRLAPYVTNHDKEVYRFVKEEELSIYNKAIYFT